MPYKPSRQCGEHSCHEYCHGVPIGWLALLGSLGLLMLYLPGSPSALLWPVEWGLVGAWFVLGLVLYRVCR